VIVIWLTSSDFVWILFYFIILFSGENFVSLEYPFHVSDSLLQTAGSSLLRVVCEEKPVALSFGLQRDLSC